MNIRKKLILCMLVLVIPCSALSETYKISMIPRHSAEENLKIMSMLAKYFSSKTGKTIEPLITRDYFEFEKALLSGEIDISIENPSVYVRVASMHEVIASAVDNLGGGMVRGLVIARKGGSIKMLSDIKGKKVCIVGKTSTAGFLSPKLKLSGEGIVVEKDCTLVEAVENKQENVIFSVLAGDADAGFIKESAFHKADEFIPPGSLAVIGEGAWLPNDAFSVKKTLPQGFKNDLFEAAKSLNEFDEIMVGLGLSSWRAAKDSAYDSVRAALVQ